LIHSVDGGDDDSPSPDDDRNLGNNPDDILGVSVATTSHPFADRGDVKPNAILPWQFAAAWRRIVPSSRITAGAVRSMYGPTIAPCAVEAMLTAARHSFQAKRRFLLSRQWPTTAALSLSRLMEAGAVGRRITRAQFESLVLAVHKDDTDEEPGEAQTNDKGYPTNPTSKNWASLNLPVPGCFMKKQRRQK
jgi:hypothetical protein